MRFDTVISVRRAITCVSLFRLCLGVEFYVARLRMWGFIEDRAHDGVPGRPTEPSPPWHVQECGLGLGMGGGYNSQGLAPGQAHGRTPHNCQPGVQPNYNNYTTTELSSGSPTGSTLAREQTPKRHNWITRWHGMPGPTQL